MKKLMVIFSLSAYFLLYSFELKAFDFIGGPFYEFTQQNYYIYFGSSYNEVKNKLSGNPYFMWKIISDDGKIIKAKNRDDLNIMIMPDYAGNNGRDIDVYLALYFNNGKYAARTEVVDFNYYTFQSLSMSDNFDHAMNTFIIPTLGPPTLKNRDTSHGNTICNIWEVVDEIYTIFILQSGSRNYMKLVVYDKDFGGKDMIEVPGGLCAYSSKETSEKNKSSKSDSYKNSNINFVNGVAKVTIGDTDSGYKICINENNDKINICSIRPLTKIEKSNIKGLEYEDKQDWQNALAYFKNKYKPDVADEFINYHIGRDYWKLAKLAKDNKMQNEYYCKALFYFDTMYISDGDYRDIINDEELIKYEKKGYYDNGYPNEKIDFINNKYKNCEEINKINWQSIREVNIKRSSGSDSTFKKSLLCSSIKCADNTFDTFAPMSDQEKQIIWNKFIKYATLKDNSLNALNALKFDGIDLMERTVVINLSSSNGQGACKKYLYDNREKINKVQTEYFGDSAMLFCP